MGGRWPRSDQELVGLRRSDFKTQEAGGIGGGRGDTGASGGGSERTRIIRRASEAN